jgi:hypothetical protein
VRVKSDKLKKYIQVRSALECEREKLQERLSGIDEALNGQAGITRTTENVPESFPNKQQRRLDQLMRRNNEGLLSLAEERELQILVETVQQLAIRNAHRLLQHRDRVPKPSVEVHRAYSRPRKGRLRGEFQSKLRSLNAN